MRSPSVHVRKALLFRKYIMCQIETDEESNPKSRGRTEGWTIRGVVLKTIHRYSEVGLVNLLERKERRRRMNGRINKQGFRKGVKIPQKRKWYSLIDKIWAMPNMEEAFKEVKRNRGTAGVDGVTIKVFQYGLEDNVQILQRELRVYLPTQKWFLR